MRNKYMFFVRDEAKITIFGVNIDSICAAPEINNEEHVMGDTDDQSTQSLKLKDLNIDKQDREKFSKIESNLNKSQKLLNDYWKPSQSDIEEQKECSKKLVKHTEIDELGQINERETESGGNNERNHPKLDEQKMPKLVKEETKQEEQYERSEHVQPPPKQEKVRKISDKKEAKKDIKVVEYNLDAIISDEAGGNLDDYSSETHLGKDDELKETNKEEDENLIQKVRTTTTHKNIKDSEYQKNLNDKNKKRRNRLERENKEHANEYEDRSDGPEESKEDSCISLGESQSNVAQNFTKQDFKKHKSTSKLVDQFEEKQRASISEVEEVKQVTEENKEQTDKTEEPEGHVESMNDESKQEEGQLEQADRQPSNIKQTQKTEMAEVHEKEQPRQEKKKSIETSKTSEVYE
jgi:hypothetical protein